MCQRGDNRNSLLGYLMSLPSRIYLTPKQGVEKSRFEVAAKRLEIEENVNIARVKRLALNLCLEQSYSFRQSHKRVNTDRPQYVRSSSGLITIVLMTLFKEVIKCCTVC